MQESHKDKHKIYYVCEGTCGGKVTEEEWQSGKKTCAAEDCPLHGKPLVRKTWCDECSRWCDE